MKLGVGSLIMEDPPLSGVVDAPMRRPSVQGVSLRR